MYELLAVLIGFLGALMMTMNGELGRALGSLPGNLVVHLSGLVLVVLLVAAGRGGRRLPRGAGPARLSGGALGFVSVLLVNLSFPALGVALTLGLSLLGQALASVLVDATGVLWAERKPFRPRLLLSLGLIALGIAVMSLGAGAAGGSAAGAASGAAAGAVPASGAAPAADGPSLGAGLLALVAGFTTIAGRRVNARLAADSDPMTSALWNYLVGTACAGLALGLLLGAGFGGGALLGPFGRASTAAPTAGGLAGTIGPAPAWAWFGGAVGLLFVILSNRVTPKLGAYAMAILVFLGQVGGSLLVEAALRGRLDAAKLWGGALILAGLVLKVALERGGLASSGRKAWAFSGR